MTTTEEPLAQAKPPFLRRVRIRGYKSIAFCDVTLEPLTILVGRNASGKSNFLDALAFLRDAMKYNLSEAINRRGGMDSLLCRVSNSNQLSIEVEGDHLPETPGEDCSWEYGLEVPLRPSGWPSRPNEWFRRTRLSDRQVSGFTSKEGKVSWSNYPSNPNSGSRSLTSPDHLMLTVFGHPGDPYLAHGFQSMGFYNFSPEAMRQPQKPTHGGLLERDGRNLASAIETSRTIDNWAVDRVAQYLTAITRSIEFAGVGQVGGYEILRFLVHRNENGQPLEFPADSMSDGTLRAFAALMAAFQMILPHDSPSLVAIEEPETALHPAAMRALVAAMDEATLRTQILLTTHSPDLLDAEEVKPENIRVVQLVDGKTVIGPVDEASVSIVRDHLSTLGGLERDRQLEPDIEDLERQSRLAQQEQPSS
jgi:predicted ATPase